MKERECGAAGQTGWGEEKGEGSREGGKNLWGVLWCRKRLRERDCVY